MVGPAVSRGRITRIGTATETLMSGWIIERPTVGMSMVSDDKGGIRVTGAGGWVLRELALLGEVRDTFGAAAALAVADMVWELDQPPCRPCSSGNHFLCTGSPCGCAAGARKLESGRHVVTSEEQG